MSDIKTFLTLLIPIPPFILAKDNKYPKVLKLYQEFIKYPDKSKNLGIYFIRICRLTGFAWWFWAINFINFVIMILLLLFCWGKDLDMAKAIFFYGLSYQKFISILGSFLFVFQMFYKGVVVYANQQVDCSVDIINNER